MPSAKLTKAVIDRMGPGELIWDKAVIGFGARCQLRDVFYVLRYRLSKRQRMVTIGRHGSPYTVDTARNEAKRMLGLVAQEVDPRAPPSTDTFIGIANLYLERKRLTIRPSSFNRIERHLRLYSQPLHHSPLADINRRMVAQRLAEIETNSGSITRNRVRASLSAMFVWAIKEGLIELNPVTGTGRAAENSRHRTLSPGELSQILKCLPTTTRYPRSHSHSQEFGEIVRLLVLTGQRREEIGGLRWSEVDLNRKMIVLPPERTKNNQLHELSLSKPAYEIIERRHMMRAYPMIEANVMGQPRPTIVKSEFVFGRRFNSWSWNKKVLDKQFNIPPWTIHDIRRSVATLMAEELNILPHIIEAILNHISGHKAGVAGIYNRARYQAQMKEALEDWANYVTKLEKAD
jgi:integrase